MPAETPDVTANVGVPNGSNGDDRVLIDALVTRAVAGELRARDELLGLIHPLVLKYCRARLGRQESLMGSADDVAQDVCMAVVGALPHYRIKGLSFRAFVYGIAAHKVTDAFRAIGRNRAEPVAELPDGPVAADGPEHRLLAAEMSVRLGALLAHLTPRQREVLVLRLAVGLSAEETAQVMRSVPSTVRATQHQALHQLRWILLGGSAEDLPDTDAVVTELFRQAHPEAETTDHYLRSVGGRPLNRIDERVSAPIDDDARRRGWTVTVLPGTGTHVYRDPHPDRRRLCDTCGGSGRAGARPCPPCDGTGVVTERLRTTGTTP